MGRTACTEPQCLYSRAIPVLPLWVVRSVQSLSACNKGVLYLLLLVNVLNVLLHITSVIEP
jgi:hypothetical protein